MGKLAAMPDTRIRLMAYGPDHLDEREIATVAELAELPSTPVVWINVDGTGDLELVRALGERFALHPLVVDDIQAHHERAKVDSYEGMDFMVVRMLELAPELSSEQLSMCLTKTLLLTFQEHPGGDPFDGVRDRIRKSHGPLRRAGPDLLAYALLDAVVNAYFPVLEAYGERIEGLEDEVVAHPGAAMLARVHDVKHELLRMRRAVWPLREALANLGREQTPFIARGTRMYLRDLHDRTVQVVDLLETYRDLGSGLTDLYMSSVSNRLNQVMKVLTIISTIFIPLSFVAGVYGMNFDRSAGATNMPELGWRFGYVGCLALMGTIALVMLGYFWRKGWLRKEQ